MKFVSLITGILLCLIPADSFGNFIKNYFRDRYPVQIVTALPENTENNVLMVSTRNIKEGEDFILKKGLHPHYKISLYVCGLKNDTAFIVPFKYFNEIISYFPGEKDFLILVDGHGKTFGQAMARGFEMTSRFKVNTIVFDWPTDYLSLRKTVYNASEVTVSFVRAMRELSVLKNERYHNAAFSVIFHSMGNRIIKEISTTKLRDKMPPHLFNNIIINAAAVKQNNHAKWVEKLNIQKRIYITMNEKDFNLKGAALVRMAKQLGMTNRNKQARNAFYVNFNQLSTTDHNLFLGRSAVEKINPSIFTFYDLAFHGKQANPGEVAGFQILSPSDKSFLFSESKSILESP